MLTGSWDLWWPLLVHWALDQSGCWKHVKATSVSCWCLSNQSLIHGIFLEPLKEPVILSLLKYHPYKKMIWTVITQSLISFGSFAAWLQARVGDRISRSVFAWLFLSECRQRPYFFCCSYGIYLQQLILWWAMPSCRGIWRLRILGICIGQIIPHGLDSKGYHWRPIAINMGPILWDSTRHSLISSGSQSLCAALRTNYS